MRSAIDFDPSTPSKNPRLSVTLDRFLYAVLKEESHRRKVSLADVINEELAEKFATLVKAKEIEEKQKF
jgi:predicted DNA-binding ribbon-helix-helix protein